MKFNYKKSIEIGYVNRNFLRFALALKENKESLSEMFKLIPKLNWDFSNFLQVKYTLDCSKNCICCDDEYEGGSLKVSLLNKSNDNKNKFVIVGVRFFYEISNGDYNESVLLHQVFKVDFTNGLILDLGKTWSSCGFTEEEMQKEKFEETVRGVLLDVTQIKNCY